MCPSYKVVGVSRKFGKLSFLGVVSSVVTFELVLQLDFLLPLGFDWKSSISLIGDLKYLDFSSLIFEVPLKSPLRDSNKFTFAVSKKLAKILERSFLASDKVFLVEVLNTTYMVSHISDIPESLLKYGYRGLSPTGIPLFEGFTLVETFQLHNWLNRSGLF